MPNPRVHILGAYKVDVTEDLVKEAMALKYEGLALLPDEERAAESAVREELSSVVLLELAVDDPDARFDLTLFTQPESDQAPYDEAYLTLDGSSVISKLNQPQGARFRIAFFLHFFDQHRPLQTPYGEVPIPSEQQMPERLRNLIPYSPVG